MDLTDNEIFRLGMEEGRKQLEDHIQHQFEIGNEEYKDLIVSHVKSLLDETQNTTTLIDGVTECCGYDFGEDGFGKVKVKFCPLCGKRIVKI